MKQSRRHIISIDGPAGSGKSTIANLLARELNFLYIDSGAMYRAITYYMLENNYLNLPDKYLRKILNKVKITFKKKKNKQILLLNNKNIVQKIRSPGVTKNVSAVSVNKVVRDVLVRQQKQFALRGSLVMDGRDIGTIVFPKANLKIYLTASDVVRAERRKKDLLKAGEKISRQDLVEQVHKRDNIDSSRHISPLAKAQDAIVIDSTNLTINEVVNKILEFIPKEFTKKEYNKIHEQSAI